MDELDPIMLNLYELIRTATEVIDMSVAQLTAEEHICDAIVARIQKIGKAWDDNPDWHGRSWYVQVLLAVASAVTLGAAQQLSKSGGDGAFMPLSTRYEHWR